MDLARVFIATYLLAGACVGTAQTSPRASLDPASASAFARLALRCVEKEYPAKPDHVMNDASQVRSPRALHPAFYGCFDWHSCVHGHWMLVRLLRVHPDLPESGIIRRVLNRNLSRENILAEVQYLDQPNRKSFERTYGWAWLLKLVEELRAWDDRDARTWAANLEPLAQAIAVRYLDFLPRQNYPIRTGVHPNTAFGLTFALDYARTTGAIGLEKLALERSVSYFKSDTNYPDAWEPGGEDFFSPALMEAELMSRVLPETDFRKWFEAFLPDLGKGGPVSLLTPAVVLDRSDPKLVHLDGLNLSRAWCMRRIALRLPENDAVRKVLLDSAAAHLAATLPHIASGQYEGEHWLATFAVYALTQEIVEPLKASR